MKIYVYVGHNIRDLRYNNVVGRNVQYGLDGKGGLILGIEDSFRRLPESYLHPVKFIENLKFSINFCADAWNLHLTTNCKIILNVIGDLIEQKSISHEDVEIFILDDSNCKIETVSTYDDSGRLMNWPSEFFCC